MSSNKDTPDVWAAFISGKTTLIPTDFWLDDMSIESLAAKGNVDDYCNLAILIFAWIVNLRAISSKEKESRSISAAVSNLWDEFQKWYRLRPEEVCPLLKNSSSPSRVFPTIVYTRSSSSKLLVSLNMLNSFSSQMTIVCGNTFYHAGSILLLQTGMLPQSRSSASDSVVSID